MKVMSFGIALPQTGVAIVTNFLDITIAIAIMWRTATKHETGKRGKNQPQATHVPMDVCNLDADNPC